MFQRYVTNHRYVACRQLDQLYLLGINEQSKVGRDYDLISYIPLHIHEHKHGMKRFPSPLRKMLHACFCSEMTTPPISGS